MAEHDEHLEKLARYLELLPEADAEAVQCVVLLGMSHDEAAAELGRPHSTVEDQVTRGRNKLAQLAEESRRATEAGERRK
jgi:DNA-directed RNA polymerase specialized sigma24 family protein